MKEALCMYHEPLGTFYKKKKQADLFHQSFMGSCSGNCFFPTLLTIKVVKPSFDSRTRPCIIFWSSRGGKVVPSCLMRTSLAQYEIWWDSFVDASMLHSQLALPVLMRTVDSLYRGTIEYWKENWKLGLLKHCMLLKAAWNIVSAFRIPCAVWPVRLYKELWQWIVTQCSEVYSHSDV
jgi:hypothetical protein